MVFSYVKSNAKLLLISQDENEGSLTSYLDTELGKIEFKLTKFKVFN